MQKSAYFRARALPWLLLAPQLVILALFFFWPAAQALWQALHVSDPFSGRSLFVGWENFSQLLGSSAYWRAVWVTFVFSLGTVALALGVALALAVAADRRVRAHLAFKSSIIWPYAVAPAIAGLLWLFLFHPLTGVIAGIMIRAGYPWNPLLNSTDAMALVVVAAAWKQISYNFVFFLAGLQAILRSLIEAAAIDGAGPVRRSWRLIFPILSPTTFFLVVINVVYAFFDTFGIIAAVTRGGPGGATKTLVYKVYADGFVGQDLGSSAAQSVILMIIVGLLTVLQFRYVERCVSYG